MWALRPVPRIGGSEGRLWTGGAARGSATVVVGSRHGGGGGGGKACRREGVGEGVDGGGERVVVVIHGGGAAGVGFCLVEVVATAEARCEAAMVDPRRQRCQSSIYCFVRRDAHGSGRYVRIWVQRWSFSFDF